MDNQPLISVIISTYNRAGLLTRAIDSVLAQTHSNIELLIIDDASSDETHHIVLSAQTKDARVQYIRNELNRGNAETKNVGIRAASGEYIAFLDDDDEWMPTKLEKQLSLLVTTGLLCASCGMQWVEDGVVLKTTVVRNPKVSFENGGPPSTWLIHRSVFSTVGLLNPAIPSNDDGEFLVRANKQFQFAFANEPLYVHYYSTSQMTSSREGKIRAWSGLLALHESSFSPLEKSVAYTKLCVFSLINGEKRFDYLLLSLRSKWTLISMSLLLILLLPGRTASRYVLNKAMDAMRYPKSFANRYA